MSVCEERNELGGALLIAEAEAGIESSPEFSGASPRRGMASVREGQDAGGHAGAVGELRRAQERGTRRAQGHIHTVALAAPCHCSLRQAPASASARVQLRGLK